MPSVGVTATYLALYALQQYSYNIIAKSKAAVTPRVLDRTQIVNLFSTGFKPTPISPFYVLRSRLYYYYSAR
jgi:hypothetical protein